MKIGINRTMEAYPHVYDPEMQAIAIGAIDLKAFKCKNIWFEGTKYFERESLKWVSLRYNSHSLEGIYESRVTLLASNCEEDQIKRLNGLSRMFFIFNPDVNFQDLDGKYTSAVASILNGRGEKIYISPGFDLASARKIAGF